MANERTVRDTAGDRIYEIARAEFARLVIKSPCAVKGVLCSDEMYEQLFVSGFIAGVRAGAEVFKAVRDTFEESN